MLKNGKSANRNEHQNRKPKFFWHQNRKTEVLWRKNRNSDLKNSQNHKIKNLNAPLYILQHELHISSNLKKSTYFTKTILR